MPQLEIPVNFGKTGELIGIVSTPAATRHSAGCIIFNMGVDPRVGHGRINVKSARRLALQGWLTLRFDLAGLGDSLLLPTRQTFAVESAENIRQAMNFLHSEYGIEKFILFGACSGVPIAISAAVSDKRIIGIVQFDGYRFPSIRSRIRLNFQKLLRLYGNTPLRHKIVQALSERLMELKGKSRLYPSRVPKEGIEFFSQSMTQLNARNIPMLFIYTGTYAIRDTSMDQLGAFSSMLSRHHVTYVFSPKVDHHFRTFESQTFYLNAVDSWMNSPAQNFK